MEKTRPEKPHGCYDREPFRESLMVQDGYVQIGGDIQNGIQRAARMVRIPFTMSHDCRYDMKRTDPRCAGCKHA